MSLQCSICFDEIPDDTNKVVTICNHAFHSTCLIKNIVMNGSDCPNCRKNLTGEETKNNYDDEDEYYDDDEETIINSDSENEEEEIPDLEPAFDINTFLSEEDKMMQSILMEQNNLCNQIVISEEDKMMQTILFSESQNNQTYNQNIEQNNDLHNETFEEIHNNSSTYEIISQFKKKNYENFEKSLKFKNYKYYKGTYKFINELDDKPEFFVCNTITRLVEKYQSYNYILFCIRAFKTNVNSIFCCKHDILSTIIEDFDIIECDINDFISEIKPIENNKNLIGESYNIDL